MPGRIIWIVLLAGGANCVRAAAEPPSAHSLTQPSSPATRPSPADQKIQAAQQAIHAHPKEPAPYNALALALARKARETSLNTFYDQAQEALKESFRLSPNNLDGKKTEIWLLLGKHEFTDARKAAQAVNKQVPDDLLVYGFLADACIELGDYRKAEEAAQFMLDLRPGNIPGLTRGAYLRELFGDVDGALEFMGDALDRLPYNELEDRAWVLTQIAHLQLGQGGVAAAEQSLDEAMRYFPDYHYALAQMAKVRAAQHKYADAAALLERHVKAAGHAENLYYYAEALHRAKRDEEAKSVYEQFERLARAEMDRHDNANRELIYYYIGHASKAPEALRIARQEVAWRQDVYTLDAYAWALHANGQDAEARRQLDRVLAVGIRDATILYHMGSVLQQLGDSAEAEKYFTQSLKLNPNSEIADDAQHALAKIVASRKSAAHS